MKQIDIVLGAGFGDEGKGSVVNELITKNSPVETIVVRFNGGHQVGHTVVQDSVKHVFSNFGSGTLKRVPTYWSKYCTIHPLGVNNEYQVLKDKGIKPVLFIDPLCPVTTPFDIIENHEDEFKKRHGSVGVGFGRTIQRHNETPYKLFAQDLFNETILKHKLNNIANYYCIYDKDILENFMEDVKELLSNNDIRIMKLHLHNFNFNLIFEGGQGILLDQDFGFFPHVTRSNTTSKNAMEFIKENGLMVNSRITINYVSRPYLTRHGNGPLPFEDIELDITKNPNETNVSHLFQGKFRYAPLNLDLLNHAIGCDNIFSSGIQKNLWITCTDQVNNNKIKVVYNNEIIEISLAELKRRYVSVNVIFKGEE